MKTNKDVILISLSIFIGALLVQFFMSFVTTNSVWEWSEISKNVIPFGTFFLVVLYIIKEYNTRKINRNN
ncbi:hypothetical protein [Macrococcoides caseolyticum]|uniref:Uncharacterized protein n=2 Tax=Macrococcoides caseolyticum TaxID=69966 RepID=A0ACC9MQL0_9STAP|nr:hypothetical protein [Macrococcus caseolyticus]MDJ1110033.1 hypothetical protein [Macrococcus caseolyticus]PKE07290.1 hypothetical protein CW692_03235 [Macrococcus caseolyticus]PKE16918.1 hypothetical protein CW718_07360 [Macrococcus caseolyticus]PKE22543.1 hypothetical protein CW688_02370 [Macrococcus caseolyticus]PKE25181.1 hypothetical protein CW689_01565 [Macrococcus caseolyticus]